MIISINDKYRISSDTHGWAIQEARRRTNRRTGDVSTVFESIRWHSSLQGAVNGLAELWMRTSDAEGVAEALAEAKNLLSVISRALTPHIVVMPHEDLDRRERGPLK